MKIKCKKRTACLLVTLALLLMTTADAGAQSLNDCQRDIDRIKSNKSRKSAKRMARLDAKDPFFYGIGSGESSREHFALSKATKRAYRDLATQAKEALATAFVEKINENNGEESFSVEDIAASMSALEFSYKRYCNKGKKKEDTYYVDVAVRAKKEDVINGVINLLNGEDDERLKAVKLLFDAQKVTALYNE